MPSETKTVGKNAVRKAANILVKGKAVTGMTVRTKAGIAKAQKLRGNSMKRNTKPQLVTQVLTKPLPLLATGDERETTLSFRFQSAERNSKLIAALKTAHIEYAVDKDGVIGFSSDHEQEIDDIIINLRNKIFPKWQVLSCPSSSVAQYQEYMRENHIPFEEEVIDGAISFLIPRQYRPHNWQF